MLRESTTNIWGFLSTVEQGLGRQWGTEKNSYSWSHFKIYKRTLYHRYIIHPVFLWIPLDLGGGFWTPIHSLVWFSFNSFDIFPFSSPCQKVTTFLSLNKNDLVVQYLFILFRMHPRRSIRVVLYTDIDVPRIQEFETTTCVCLIPDTNVKPFLGSLWYRCRYNSRV